MSKLNKIIRFLVVSLVVVVGLFSIIATIGSKVETSRIDCNIDKINITSTLEGKNSPSGDMVTGELKITCDGAPVSGATITGSASWWDLQSIGPSNEDGVISVTKSVGLKNSDVGTNKSVDIIVNGYDENGKEADKKITIVIPIN